MLYLKAPANGLKIQLSVLNHLSNEVVVTATRAGNNAGLAQSTINREDIEKLNTGQDLPISYNCFHQR